MLSNNMHSNVTYVRTCIHHNTFEKKEEYHLHTIDAEESLDVIVFIVLKTAKEYDRT